VWWSHGVFLPDQTQTALVLQFRSAGFKLIWLDGNRPAALREFQKRNTVSEEAFNLQMHRIESTKVVNHIRPAIIDPFDGTGHFKSVSQLLTVFARGRAASGLDFQSDSGSDRHAT
jgi:hypothetical protein